QAAEGRARVAVVPGRRAEVAAGHSGAASSRAYSTAALVTRLSSPAPKKSCRRPPASTTAGEERNWACVRVRPATSNRQRPAPRPRHPAGAQTAEPPPRGRAARPRPARRGRRHDGAAEVGAPAHPPVPPVDAVDVVVAGAEPDPVLAHDRPRVDAVGHGELP